MRKEPLIFKPIDNLYAINPKYTIPGLDMIEPFGSAQWGSFLVYTTKSLSNINKYTDGTGSYIYYNFYNEKNIYIISGNYGCLDALVAVMSEEEQIQFYLNFPEIAELLKL